MKLGPRQQAFIDALESGEYKQCMGRLSILETGYCCLGVACEVALKLGLEMEVSTREAIDKFDVSHKEYDGNSSILPAKVQNFFGFHWENGRFGIVDKRSETALTEINDHGGSFKEIATFVRDNLELIFKESL